MGRNLLDDEQWLAVFNRLTIGNQDFFHHTGTVGFDFIHQFHRFDDAQGIAHFNRLAFFHKSGRSWAGRAVESAYHRRFQGIGSGHYWRSGHPAPIRPNLACLDYSAVLYGKLVAYRLDDETRIDPHKFVWVDVDRPQANQ